MPGHRLLDLQRSAGNRAVADAITEPVTGPRPGTGVARAAPGRPGPTVSRQVPAPAPTMLSTTPAVTFHPTFEVIPGALGEGVARTQDKVFRGDTLVFRADLSNMPSASASMGGTVVGDTPAQCTVDRDVATFRVVVGSMGVPAGLGEPAALVAAVPQVTLGPPLAAAGQAFSQPFRFRVVADLAWLSDRCDLAGLQLNSAFLGLKGIASQAYLNYKAAYENHKTAVDEHGKRQQLQNDVLLGILLAGIGGSIGGAVAERVKTPATAYLAAASATGSDGKLGGAAIATSLGDISKYIVRLGGVRAPASSGGGHQGSDTPSPTASPGTSKGAGMSPERWDAIKSMELGAAAKAGVDLCIELKSKMSSAWAEGRTDLADADPVQMVQQNVADMTAAVQLSDTHAYAVELWRTWIHTYGITAIPNMLGGKTRTDELRGTFAFTDSKLYDDIHAQVGDALDADIARLRSELAPDPLTEMPGS